MAQTDSDQMLIKKAYEAFNARQIDAVLVLMHPDVHWPNGWEGGYVEGHDEVRTYWTRQWNEIDPHVTPVSFNKKDNQLEVAVRQLVKDRQGTILLDGMVKHIYTIEKGLIRSMEIGQL